MADNFLSEFILDPNRITGRINSETRAFMADMLEFEPEPASQAPPPGLKTREAEERILIQNLNTPVSLAPPVQFSSVASAVAILITLVGRILDELQANLPRLLSLNPSRRDAIVQYLELLAGITHRPASSSQPSSIAACSAAPPGASGGLRKWIEGPRTPAQQTALQTYLEEVAIIAVGQALLLKNWSDRGVRQWSQSDLGRLNWALSTTLKPHLPLDRDGWQITRPNLYSWYNPSHKLQPEVWAALESWRIPDEGPNFLINLLEPTRRARPEYSPPSGYDIRFFQSLWKHIELYGWIQDQDGGPGGPNGSIGPIGPIGECTSNPLKRNKVIFSPTLRDGTLVRTGPQSIQWIGLESSHFQLMMAELMHIWRGPIAPPLWCIGTGIEVHAKDQLAFALGSPKPSVVCRIAEMEACDAAIVLEEHAVRTQGRSISSTRFREQLEGLPYFKKLRTAGTSLGALQACVALSKLRPGGILVWAREEPLGTKEGSEVLNFLLDRAKLICECDFTELEHSLPVASPVNSKHLYLFQRETQIESRLSHRPIRHSVHGQIRSHVEVPLVLEDVFQSIQAPVEQPRGQWSILSHISPTPQRDWAEKWPDPTSNDQVRRLGQLRANSLPLAHFTTIRAAHEGSPNQNGAWSVQSPLRGFWLSADYDHSGRKLIARPLPKMDQKSDQEPQGQGFLILVSDETWVTPLSAYLMSDWVQKWLDYNAERRGDRWILNEQIVKWIPIPKRLLQALGVPNTLNGSEELPKPSPLPEEWNHLTKEVIHQPKKVREALIELGNQEATQSIHSAVFISTARALDYLYTGQHRLFSLVTPNGGIRWREFIHILPKSECVAVPVHPKIRLTGSLPPHLPIEKMDRVKSPSPGIFLATESGFSLHIGSEIPLLLNMLWEQLEGVSHPTWNELVGHLKIPRRIELAESTALEVLRSHGEQSARLKDLQDLLLSCQLF